MSIGTIIVLIIVVAVVAAIIRKLFRDRREGRSSCGCGCQGCAMKESCHSVKEGKNSSECVENQV